MSLMTIMPDDTATLRRLATETASLWDAEPGTTGHISDSGNSVYLFRSNGERLILRLTSPTYRTRAQLEAEIEFLLHLDACAVRIGKPVRSRHGEFVEDARLDGMAMLASAFTFAPGIRVMPDSEHWNEVFFREWGATLGRIHRAAGSFVPATDARRWHWREEGFIALAPQLIPAEDTASHRELERVMRRLDELPVDTGTFGIIHADFAPQNFNYEPALGITTFDFGNCCYHWYLSDLAISLSTIRRRPPEVRDLYRRWIIEGYREHYPIDDDLLANISWLIRLRILYVYLSRLALFGPNPAPEEQETLRGMRDEVHAQFIW